MRGVDLGRMFRRNITLAADVAPVRHYLDGLVADVLAGTLDPLAGADHGRGAARGGRGVPGDGPPGDDQSGGTPITASLRPTNPLGLTPVRG